MHLDLATYYFRPRADRWTVIDDFGTEHSNFLSTTQPSEFSYQSERQRYDFIDSAEQDPDYTRLTLTEPRIHYMRELMSFSTTFGLCVELELRIDFWLCPAWNDVQSEPLESRADGATIEIISIRTQSSYEVIDTCATSMPELIELCWQYLELERVREAAEERARAEARARKAETQQ
jgi:hypothetical protein